MSEAPFSWLGGGIDTPPEEALEEQSKLQAELFQKQMELAQLVHRVFLDNSDGAILLDWLQENTILKPLMRVSGNLAECEIALSPADWAYVREGQNSVVRFLMDQIELARNPPNQGTENDGQ